MENSKLVRTFICIDFPEEVIREVARVQGVLENWKFTGKMTELENLHLTLKFLGEIDEKKLKEVREKLKGIKFGEIQLKLGNAGSFSFRGSPRIIWIKLVGKGIYELQEKIDNVLSEIGIKKEERFMGHITLARVKYVENKLGFKEYINDINLRDTKFVIDRFKLKSSELKTLGPEYGLIEEYAAEKK